ncbi:hypothetical protein MCSF7_01019 [Mycoplasmopsis columbina SF7]|uniref:Uncharacterized protein n=1 Tax=Mycoplasmopsis columbina SF7 TaxID=1037410 RepID=F9UJZ7_9BACT|nr:hypothetical protein MCSF7_01019 [Mycoplasmopsis columbina SF7]
MRNIILMISVLAASLLSNQRKLHFFHLWMSAVICNTYYIFNIKIEKLIF